MSGESSTTASLAALIPTTALLLPIALLLPTPLMIEYLSEEQVLHLHRVIIAAMGGADGVRDRGLLQSAVARPAASFGGQELYPSVPAKAAALMHSLVSKHAFVDGNKRVAIAAAELFLQANAYRLSADTDALEELTMATESAHIGVEEIRIWLEQRIRRE